MAPDKYDRRLAVVLMCMLGSAAVVLAAAVYSYTSSRMEDRIAGELEDTVRVVNESIDRLELHDCCTTSELVVVVITTALFMVPTFASVAWSMSYSTLRDAPPWVQVVFLSCAPVFGMSAVCSLVCYRADVSTEAPFGIALVIAGVWGVCGWVCAISEKQGGEAVLSGQCGKIFGIPTANVARMLYLLMIIFASVSIRKDHELIHSDCERWVEPEPEPEPEPELQPEPEPEPQSRDESRARGTTQYVYTLYTDEATGPLGEPGCCSGTEPFVYTVGSIVLFFMCCCGCVCCASASEADGASMERFMKGGASLGCSSGLLFLVFCTFWMFCEKTESSTEQGFGVTLAVLSLTGLSLLIFTACSARHKGEKFSGSSPAVVGSGFGAVIAVFVVFPTLILSYLIVSADAGAPFLSDCTAMHHHTAFVSSCQFELDG